MQVILHRQHKADVDLQIKSYNKIKRFKIFKNSIEPGWVKCIMYKSKCEEVQIKQWNEMTKTRQLSKE